MTRILLLAWVSAIFPCASICGGTIRFPDDAGHIDVKLKHGARGDGQADDTKALQEALKQRGTIYLPTGTYLLSDTVVFDDKRTLCGEDRDKTVIRLRDNAPGFGDPAKPKAVIKAGFDSGGSSMWVFLCHFTLDTGKGNPGAVGIDYHSNNTGTVEDVTIRSGDGAGHAGLALVRGEAGPGLVNDIRVEGFDYGIRAKGPTFNHSFLNITVRGQRKAGLFNDNLPIDVENLTSVNSVPAVSGHGYLTLVNADLSGGSSDQYAIDYQNGMYARNLRTAGYAGAMRLLPNAKAKPDEATIVPGPNVQEHLAGKVSSLFPSPQRMLNLPVKPTPSAPYEPPEKWVSVAAFESKVQGGDWSGAIQAAVDSGAATIYFPAGKKYLVRKPVMVHGNVTRIVGMRSVVFLATEMGMTPAFRAEGDGKQPLIVEFLDFRPEKYGDAITAMEQAGKQTLVYRHGKLSLSTAAGAGEVYLEDTLGPLRINGPINVWARGINIESGPDVPQIVNDAGTLWVMGFKQEKHSPVLVNRNGAASEIVSCAIYPIRRQVDKPLACFINEESSLSARFIYVIWVANKPAHDVLVRDTRDGVTKELPGETANRWGLPLYVSWRDPALSQPTSLPGKHGTE